MAAGMVLAARSACALDPIGDACVASVAQSSDAAVTNGAMRARDGVAGTFSLTQDLPGSWWAVSLIRPYAISRIEVVNRAAPCAAELDGLTLRLMDLDDQVVHQTTLSNPGPSGTWSATFGTPRKARTIWIGLDGASTNGGGTRRVGLAEVRIHGDAALPFGPPVPGPSILPSQSSDLNVTLYPASNALDGRTNTFTHTQNLTNSFWFADLMVPRALDRIELVNRADAAPKRMGGLILRVMDSASNTVDWATVTNPGAGKVWTYWAPASTTGRYVRVGLEGGVTNGDGNFYVTLAEARFFSGTNQLPVLGYAVPSTGVVNFAAGATSWMVRLTSTLAPASNANDGVYATESKTTTQTVDGYWEVDLGATFALYGVRAIAASGIGQRLTNTTLRLYDAAHESVFSKMLAGSPDAFDIDIGGPVFARYVRIGLEDKRRTSPTGGTEWYIGMREVEVFGRATNEVGILALTSSATNVAPGGSATLSWTVADVRRVEIHPAVGSVGAQTDTAGQGSLVLSPTSSVEYVMIASNPAGIFARAVGVTVGGAPLPLRISEFVADNQFSLEDGYGAAPDWIELRNPGNAPVDLAGWGLSDDPAVPFRWTLPAGSLAPHETLIVFASGRAAPVDPAGHLHAPFRLASAGGSLVLTAPGGATADAIADYPAQTTDLAYGRDLGGRTCFLEPTPRRVNAATPYEGWLRPVEFSHKRGFYDAPFTLVVSNDNPGSTVRLSYDGSPPTNPCPAAIPVAATRTIRALVTRPDHRSPRIKTHTYVFVDSVITASTMRTNITQDARYAPRMRPGLLALPSVCVSLTGSPSYDEVEGSIEILWPGGGKAVQANCGIARFGSSWQSFAKQSFRAKFRPEYGARKLEAPLFGGFDRGILAKTSFDEIDLRAGNQDMNARGFYMAGRFVEDSMLDMGSLNPHGRFVHVYLNGAYWGQYDMRELLVDHMLADYLGGEAEDYVTVRGNDNVGGAFVLGAPDPPNVAPWERALALRGDYASVRDFVDVPNLVDFMLLWFYGNCESEYRSAGPLDAGSGFKFWMADADGFLRTNALTVNTTASTGPGGLFGGLNAEGNAEFRTLLADRIHRHLFNDGALTPARNGARLGARMDEIRDSLLAECARWGYQTPSSWEAARSLIETLLFPVRTTQLVAQVRARGYYPALDAPAFEAYGGLATNGYLPVMNAPSGTIYYTTDGSDPRLPGGGTSLAARIWTAGGLVVTQDVTVSARVRAADGSWSALASPRFLLAGRAPPGVRDLVVTEIHYNPAGDDSTEFVELYNAGTNLLDLSGVSLTNGVRFVFPQSWALAPGRFAIVAEDTNAFRARYQDPASPWYRAGLEVVGEWAGSLANEGETFEVAASNGTVLVSIPYGTGGDWPERADGGGSSLELRTLPPATNDEAAVAAHVAQARNWTSSARYHGSPGLLGGEEKTVRIAEVLSHTDADTDWIEIGNRGTAAADLSGLWLTDDADRPQRFRIPDGTVVGPGECVAFGAAQLGFAFSELGGAAMLLEMAGTNVLRFVDTVDFPAASREEPFGLYERSDGGLDFTELRATTRNAPNALPRVGPVVISEIHCATTNGPAPFIEISNISTSAVPLYHPAFPTNVWRIEGLGPYVFPADTVLAPLESALVCATNPADFAAQYGTAPAVRIFGPWPGRLDPDGETLKLLRPGDPEPDGFVPYYRVDRVAFRVAAPWPVPAAGGSIERTPVEAYGNDPASWREGPEQGSPGVPRANRPPAVNVPDLVEAAEGSAVTVSVWAVDLDVPWQTVSLTSVALPGGAAFAPGLSAMTWIPGELDGATTQGAVFVATDSAPMPASVTGETRIAVAEVNSPPVWTPRADLSWPSGTPLDLAVAASDPDVPLQMLTFRGEGLPDGLAVDPSSGGLGGICAVTGTWSIAILVSDDGAPSLQATNRFLFRATPPFALDLGAATGQGALLSFPSVTGGDYVIEASGSLVDPDWHPVAAVSNAAGEVLEWEVPSSATATSRFYRVRWRPQ